MSAPTTPAGVHLGHLTPGTPEWDAARGGLCVTATEIAAVMGLSPWQSRFTLWHKKAGLPTPRFEASREMRMGSRLEPLVEEDFLDAHPEFLSNPAGTFRHHARPWQRATPDRLLYSLTPDPGWDGATGITLGPSALLEIKTSPFGDGWENGVPVHYLCQIQWQLDTLGLTRCHVALLIGAGWEYREYVVEHDADEAELLRTEARAFLDSVERGERPTIDGATDTYQTVRAQHPGRDDVEVEIPAQLADRYEAAGAAQKAVETERRQAAAEVLDAIGDGRWAIDPSGRRVAQRTTAGSLTPCKQKDLSQ